MTLAQLTICSIFGIALAVGQIFFKLAADSWAKEPTAGVSIGNLLHPWFLTAGAWYTALAVLWVYILKSTELSKAFLFQLAGSALVPLLAWLVFKEALSLKYMIGAGLILVGVFLCTVK